MNATYLNALNGSVGVQIPHFFFLNHIKSEAIQRLNMLRNQSLSKDQTKKEEKNITK